MRARIIAVLIGFILLATAAPRPAAAQAPQAVTLGSAMASALERHPSVSAAERSFVAAQARLVQARAGSAVQVSANAGASVGTIGVSGLPTGGSASSSSNATIDATLSLYDGGIRVQQVAQAQAGVDAAEASLVAARQDAAQAAAQAYFDVLRAQRTVEVREAALRSAQAQVAQAEAFVRAGAGAQADVIRVQAAAASAQADLVAAQGQVETSQVSLRAAMALPLSQAVSVAEPAAPVPVVMAPTEAATQAVTQRSEVRQAEANIRSAEATLRIAQIRAGLLLNVNANAGVEVAPNPGQAGWSVSATVSFPLANGGSSKAAVDEARANVQAATARREVTVLQVQTQAYQAAASVRDAGARVEATRVSASAADEALRVTEGRYRAGVGIVLDVLDAQASATSARIAATQALYDLQQAIVTLQHALGRPLVAGR